VTRTSLLGAAGLAAGLITSTCVAEIDLAAIDAAIAANHDEAVARLQNWIRLPSIAAEDRGFPEGPEYMAELLRDAGFQHVEVVPTDGKPGVFATLDAGAEKTLGIYFMYDVKQFDASEWSSPPLDAALVERPGLGTMVMGRGAVNQKGPESAFLAALHAFQATGQQLPVNLVLVAEGEEEIASPNVRQIALRPDVQAALSKCVGVMLPHALQGLDGNVTINLGAKGVVELELTSSGLLWGRGPMRDTHSSYKAMIDSPVWRLVQALQTLVTPDGNTPAIDDYMANVRPLLPEEKELIAVAAQRQNEMQYKVASGAQVWIDDLPFLEALERLVSQPTVNIEGIYGGYTGPGGKTILPYKAAAKLDLRLVPNMTADEAVAKLRAHLEAQGFGDIDINVTGGYNPTTTDQDSEVIQAMVKVLNGYGIEPLLWPRLAGSYPGFVFTDPPLNLPAGHFGMGYGTRAHAPDEFYVIESENPNIQGYDGAVRSYVDYLIALAEL